MKQALLDTDVLSLYLRQGDAGVVAHCRRYLRAHGHLTISILTYYEIVSGLSHKDARKQLAAFHRFTARNIVLPITEQSARIAAEQYARLHQSGTPVDDIDLLIAGIALEHDLVLITRNRRHFDRIDGLSLDDWARSEPAEDLS